MLNNLRILFYCYKNLGNRSISSILQRQSTSRGLQYYSGLTIRGSWVWAGFFSGLVDCMLELSTTPNSSLSTGETFLCSQMGLQADIHFEQSSGCQLTHGVESPNHLHGWHTVRTSEALQMRLLSCRCLWGNHINLTMKFRWKNYF